ncbi:MAG: glycoside hydrolase family 15 protein [Bellilinea sp.]
MDLIKQSIEIILNNQDSGGAFVACPTFPNYQYCWLRDGSFVAHAMDQVGQFESAEKFFRWVGKTILRYSSKISVLEGQLKSGTKPDHRGILNTRFTLDGLEENVESEWGNFQIDGYGTWLWALAEHVKLSGNTALLNELYEPIQLTLRYLELVWKHPNYDCWEEYPEYLHPYSLGTVFAGFNSIASLVRNGQMDASSLEVEDLAMQVKEFLLKYGVHAGRIVKHVRPSQDHDFPAPIIQSGVDSSLIGLAVPYHVLPLDDPLMRATIQAIEANLHRPEGGVYRYGTDVYYGGGEWLLLTAWLGWYYALTDKVELAKKLRDWIETQAGADGCLAEQVNDHTLAPDQYEPWLNKWGPVATPLLWSHAMYIILANAIREHDLK